MWQDFNANGDINQAAMFANTLLLTQVYDGDFAGMREFLRITGSRIVRQVRDPATLPPDFCVIKCPPNNYLFVITGTTNKRQFLSYAVDDFLFGEDRRIKASVIDTFLEGARFIDRNTRDLNINWSTDNIYIISHSYGAACARLLIFDKMVFASSCSNVQAMSFGEPKGSNFSWARANPRAWATSPFNLPTSIPLIGSRQPVFGADYRVIGKADPVAFAIFNKSQLIPGLFVPKLAVNILSGFRHFGHQKVLLFNGEFDLNLGPISPILSATNAISLLSVDGHKMKAFYVPVSIKSYQDAEGMNRNYDPLVGVANTLLAAPLPQQGATMNPEQIAAQADLIEIQRQLDFNFNRYHGRTNSARQSYEDFISVRNALERDLARVQAILNAPRVQTVVARQGGGTPTSFAAHENTILRNQLVTAGVPLDPERSYTTRQLRQLAYHFLNIVPPNPWFGIDINQLEAEAEASQPPPIPPSPQQTPVNPPLVVVSQQPARPPIKPSIRGQIFQPKKNVFVLVIAEQVIAEFANRKVAEIASRSITRVIIAALRTNQIPGQQQQTVAGILQLYQNFSTNWYYDGRTVRDL